MTPLEISRLCSLGEFNHIKQYFSENIVWEIIGEQELPNLDAVLKHCTQIETYFNSVQHEFSIEREYQDQNTCIIQGRALFFTAEQTTRISACDIYTFDGSYKIERIQSYCIKTQ